MDISKEFWIVRLGLKKKTSFILLQLGQNFYTAICILLVNGAPARKAASASALPVLVSHLHVVGFCSHVESKHL